MNALKEKVETMDERLEQQQNKTDIEVEYTASTAQPTTSAHPSTRRLSIEADKHRKKARDSEVQRRMAILRAGLLETSAKEETKMKRPTEEELEEKEHDSRSILSVKDPEEDSLDVAVDEDQIVQDENQDDGADDGDSGDE